MEYTGSFQIVEKLRQKKTALLEETTASEDKWNWNDLFQMFTMENFLACMEDLLTAYAISISYVDFRLVCILITGSHFSADYKQHYSEDCIIGIHTKRGIPCLTVTLVLMHKAWIS